jgi:hypothetical protein
MMRLHSVGAALSRDGNHMPLSETRNRRLNLGERVNHVPA